MVSTGWVFTEGAVSFESGKETTFTQALEMKPLRGKKKFNGGKNAISSPRNWKAKRWEGAAERAETPYVAELKKKKQKFE